jgi:O-antigen/teichoic acid export membrane protein
VAAVEVAAPPAAPSVWRHIWRDVLLLGAGSVAVVIAQLCFRSILIATLLPAEYGRLSLVLGIYNTVWILGTSGLPNTVSRWIALKGPAADRAIVRSAIRANAWLTLAAAAVVATVSALLLHSPLAGLFGAIGLAGLVYSLLTMGIMRGRGRMVPAAAVLPIAALAELTPLVLMKAAGADITAISAFAVFSLGNVVGVGFGVYFVRRTAPPKPLRPPPAEDVPSPLRLLGFSVWLAAATAGLSLLPLIVRAVAAFDSYTVVAIVDVALVLFTVPQRLGTVIVLAAIPRASRAVQRQDLDLTISFRAHLIAIVPFAVLAAVVAFSPLVGWAFEAIGQPDYEQSARYLALALLAGPARILYGLVESALVAHGDGRFLAGSVLSITAVAAVLMLVAAALGSVTAAFVVFVAAFWLIYLVGARRVGRIAALPRRTSQASQSAPK